VAAAGVEVVCLGGLVYGRRRWRTSCLVGVCGVVLARGVPSLISVLEPRAGRGD